ncbi:hypothetical protein TVAG_351840 [Trichomonas vaginalis G3]|uniref:CCZ1/INTU/HSP4 first Longin domain-containing protein n=1 Tax=Trichomonas vaginalis (strain ATCC PRA-98 / G3) TaxID=412133 RepID=A2DZR8_TRIV3|nr:vacuolar fusion protein CCZ1 homolog-related family [Trichomonas vaginalis G3]EAY14136.1 hypothetical protein TVAG_351840 [Trichomonas vaginalis G3]KAI5525146.1 vacuolar fusion protein CCZ1 homolog-related family [Trichomonas vaginalis G3]|eukprot:XP_001326359.1 hypothetical protein [Trichomonas vaginalis G3]
MSELDQSSPLSSFFVFSSELPEEGETVKVFYYYPECKTQEDINNRDLETGISSTFVFFANRFNPDNPCDYIFTGKREIGLLEIGNGIFFNVSIKSTTGTKRILLNQILKTCLLMLNYVAGPLTLENDNKSVSKEWISRLQTTMPHIIKIINWKDPVFELLWDSFVPSQTHLNSKQSVQDEQIRETMKKYPFIESVIFTWRDKIITMHGIEPQIARILSMLVFHKFEMFFPFKTKKREDVLRWTIGFIMGPDKSIEIFTPPIFYNDKIHPLAVLQLNKIRIIVLLDPFKIFDINLLQQFSKDINPVARSFDSIESRSNSIIKQNIFNNNTGIRMNYSPNSHELNITNNNIQIYDCETIERGILLSHAFSKRIGPESRGIIPLNGSFYSFFDSYPYKFELIEVMQFKPKSLSEALEEFSKLEDI